MSEAPERIFICKHFGEYGSYFPEAVEAEGEYGGEAVEYVRADLDMIDPAALVAGAYEASANELAKAAQSEAEINNPRDAELLWYMEKRIRALTHVGAQRALDAAKRNAVNEKLDAVVARVIDLRIPTLPQTGKNGYALARKEITAAILAMKESE